jgi:ABC-type hemin transport system ATPase subunit
MQLAGAAAAKSRDGITVRSEVLSLFRGINLACQFGDQVILGHRGRMRPL